jgi:hypothetical protein
MKFNQSLLKNISGKGKKDALFLSEASPASPNHLAVAQQQLGPHERSPRVRSRLGVEATWARAAILLARLGQKEPIHARNNRDRPITIDGCAWISAEQKSLRRSHALTLAHSFPDPPASLLPTRARE